MAFDSRTRFGSFEADLATGELFNNGVRLPLQEKPFQILTLLLQTPGRLVTRQEICSKLWPDVFVESDLCLNTAVHRLRRVLEKADPTAEVIVSVGRRGYRLGAEVKLPAAAAQARFGSRLAVLPFTNLSDETRDYFSDGLTEQLIVHLGRACKEASVIAPFSSLYFKRTAKSLPEIIRELQADYVLSGTVWRIPPRLRITARLIRADDQRCIWSESYARQEAEIFLVQDEITAAIARGLFQALTEPPASHSPLTTTPAVYEKYLKARFLAYRFVQSAFEESAQLFQQVIGEDPNFALAHAGLALMLAAMATHGGAPLGLVYERIERHAAAALALCEAIADAHLARGWNAFWAADWMAAENSLSRALEINPSSSLAHCAYAYLLSVQGRHEQALLSAERAFELDPVSPINTAMVGYVHYWAGRMERALKYLQNGVDVAPRFAPLLQVIALVQEAMGKRKEAARSARAAAECSPDTAMTQCFLARSLALEGDTEGASRILCELLRRQKTNYPPVLLIGLIHAALGHREQAWECLQAAVRERDPWRLGLRMDPVFKVFWNDARFPGVLREIGLPLPPHP